MEAGKRSNSKTSKAQVKSDEETSAFVQDKKNRAVVKTHGIDNVRFGQFDSWVQAATFEHPGSFSASTHTLDKTSLKDFIDNCDIEILSLNEEEIVFDLIGVEPPLANALRRILIAEIPTMAIEKVNMWQNSSIIPDENLAHRVGLIPIKVDPRMFELHKKDEDEQATEGDDSYSETDSIRFKLDVRCTKKDPTAPLIINNTKDEDKLYNNANVYSGQLQWIPVGDQKQRFGSIRPVFEDILIAKLRPGQEIEMELICEKGIGKTHAKWSPVSTAFYRLVPDIKFKSEIKNQDAEDLKKLCPTGVFDIEDLGKKGSKIKFVQFKLERAIVKNIRACTTCRECIRHDRFKDVVDLGKIKDRFEFHVESVGMYSPQDLVKEALLKLKEKVHYWLEVLEQDQEGDEGEESQGQK